MKKELRLIVLTLNVLTRTSSVKLRDSCPLLKSKFTNNARLGGVVLRNNAVTGSVFRTTGSCEASRAKLGYTVTKQLF